MSSLKNILEDNNIDSSDLDDMVHDAAGRIASRVNNEGLSDQLEFIERAGFSDQEILTELGLPEDLLE